MMTTSGILFPSVIITDRNLACMNAIAREFPAVPSTVCRWHMKRNVLAKARLELGQVLVDNPAPNRDKYENTAETDAFMAAYHEAANSTSEPEFEQR